MGMVAVSLKRSLGSDVETRDLSRAPYSLQAYAGLNIHRDQTTPQCEQNQLGVALEIESVHDVVLMELHCLFA